MAAVFPASRAIVLGGGHGARSRLQSAVKLAGTVAAAVNFGLGSFGRANVALPDSSVYQSVAGTFPCIITVFQWMFWSLRLVLRASPGLAGVAAANTVLEHGGSVILLDKSLRRSRGAPVGGRLSERGNSCIVVQVHPAAGALRRRFTGKSASNIVEFCH